MGYRIMGRVHAAGCMLRLRRLPVRRGQGTVEYVALILLVAGVLAASSPPRGSLKGKRHRQGGRRAAQGRRSSGVGKK